MLAQTWFVLSQLPTAYASVQELKQVVLIEVDLFKQIVSQFTPLFYSLCQNFIANLSNTAYFCILFEFVGSVILKCHFLQDARDLRLKEPGSGSAGGGGCRYGRSLGGGENKSSTCLNPCDQFLQRFALFRFLVCLFTLDSVSMDDFGSFMKPSYCL